MKNNASGSSSPDKNPHLFKKKYTRSEVEQLVSWFDDKIDKLPNELRLNESTIATNLPKTVRSLSSIILAHQNDSFETFGGYVSHLELIRLRLQEMNFA